MKTPLLLLPLLLFALPCLADGPEQPTRRAIMAARAHTAPHVDGRLDDEAWASAEIIEDFKQRDPVEGNAPTERTTVRVLFDGEALYVGARMYDSAPDSIVARLGRRDAFMDSDRFVLFVDPYLDRRSGYFFSVTAGGTIGDGVLFNDSWDDDSWDGVWEGKARIDEEGWTAEFRIPYSQLRFYQKDRYVWGVNFRRDIARKNEHDYLVYTPRSESGFVSRFVDLTGIDGIKPKRQIELMPYVTSRAQFTDHDAGDPFNDGSRFLQGAGADFKIGISKNLTLNATVNPDFGQVEVDPAVVNLSDFETFFPERRPFFIEGSSIFNYGYGGANDNWGFNWGNPDLFYSRRVGRTPQGGLPDNDFADVPDGTRILGAGKLTGRVGGGWNVGTVHALTARESAELQYGGNRFFSEVEPSTYYGVGRAQREWREGFRALGFMGTVTRRNFHDDRLRDQINSEAYVMGVDGWTFLDAKKTWVVNGWAAFSNVHGTPARMTELQRSSMHYFQRPDAGHVEVDSLATSLSGFGGRIAVNKQRGHILFNSALGVIDPGFDVNDVGYQWRTDVINGHIGAGYNWSDPGSWYRQAMFITALFRSIDFEGNPIWQGVFGLGRITFLNYYSINVNAAYNPRSVATRLTRGGPLALNPPGFQLNVNASTDNRKPWVIGLNAGTYTGPGGTNMDFGTEIEWKPAANINLQVGPNLSLNRDHSQWVDAFDDPYAVATYGRRYVFADLDQVTLSSNIRLNWTFTPELSLQLFAQPLISSGDYSGYKELAKPRTYSFLKYGEAGSTYDPVSRMADPDGTGPAAPIELPQNDFNFKSLRGNAVLRWEYRPGSTLYLVWTQSRSMSDEYGDFRFRNSVGRLFEAQPDNIFMVKLTYWLSR